MLAQSPITTPQPGTVLGGKYRVERSIGAGGMGAVVAATHLELHQEVAIKVLLPGAAKSEEANSRFIREGRAAARLTSPYAAKVFDTGRLPSGEPYLVMELLSGRDLRAHMAEAGRVPLAQAVEWGLQAAHALLEAHKLQVIHRDVKPANLFLADTSAGTIVKVLDFGVSRQLDDLAADLTNTASVLGTPRYMAPEQMRSARLADSRCDVWSLGVVLYELTTGESPFRGESITALCFDVMERTPIPPSRHNPELPPAFDAFMARCLAKDPDQRFPTMDALAQSLQSFTATARPSLPGGTGEETPAASPSMTPGPTVAPPRPHVRPEPRQGLQKWLFGVGSAVGLTAAAALALTFLAPPGAPDRQAVDVQSAAADEPSALTPRPPPVVVPPAPTGDPTQARPIESGPDIMPAPSAAPTPTNVYPETQRKRLPPGVCNPPTWRDKDNRLVPKPYCL